jgi:hypothetical protein
MFVGLSLQPCGTAMQRRIAESQAELGQARRLLENVCLRFDTAMLQISRRCLTAIEFNSAGMLLISLSSAGAPSNAYTLRRVRMDFMRAIRCSAPERSADKAFRRDPGLLRFLDDQALDPMLDQSHQA